MKTRTILKIVFLPIMAVACGAAIYGNAQCVRYSNTITNYLSPATVTYDNVDGEHNRATSDETIQQIAAEGVTLLKNDNHTLPLDVKADTPYPINLFGIGSTENPINGFYLFGGGSGSVNLSQTKAVFLKQGVEQAGFKVNSSLYKYFNDNGNPGTDWWKKDQPVLKQAQAFSNTAVVTISRFNGENVDDPTLATDNSQFIFPAPWRTEYQDTDKDGRDYLQLSMKEETMIDWVSNHFEKVIVLVDTGNAMCLNSIKTNAKVGAALYTSYPGQSGANQIGNILAGKVNPSGHLSDTLICDTRKTPFFANAFKADKGYGMQINYSEDIYVGYKWYETADHDGYFTKNGDSYDDNVVYPFGHGLSYTSFKWTLKGASFIDGDNVTAITSANNTLSKKTDLIRLDVHVENTGDVAGKDVVQVYDTAPYVKGGIEKPYVSLANFAKTDLLYPSASADDKHPNSQDFSIDIDPYYLASYDCYDKNKNQFMGWELDSGEYHLKLQNNAHQINQCENSDITFTVPTDGFKFDKDPVTGNEVSNRFTGDTAEANDPIDGSGFANEPITYLSRNDFDSTFPGAMFKHRVDAADLTSNGDEGIYSDEMYKDIKTPVLDVQSDNPLLLYTLEDGSKASLDDLNYNSDKGIKANEDLILKLGSNYDDPDYDKMMSQMSFHDVATLVATAGGGPRAIASIGKPKFRDTDGPEGFTNSYLSPEKANDVSAFTAETLVGMTWNKDLAFSEGSSMGTELSDVAYNGIYAPALDLHRHPYNGRNYEQYGEDPILVGTLGANVVHGMLTHGIHPYIKHFICSTPGQNPGSLNSWLTEQNLRENYLRSFEIAVKVGKANSVMTSFNNLGGVKCAFSYGLNTQILRQEWGFKGSLLTDAGVSTDNKVRGIASLVRSGNDLMFGISDLDIAGLSETNPVDVKLGYQSAKNYIYTVCNAYYITKNYNPNFTTVQRHEIPGKAWWKPILVIADVIIFGGCIIGALALFGVFKKKKSKVDVTNK